MSREIKFRVIRGNKIVGYERLNKCGWEWMCPDLNPDTGERWNLGVMNLTYRSDEYKREQYTGLNDKNGKEIYEGDIIKTVTDKAMVIGWSERFASFVIMREGWAFQHWFGESCDPQDCEVVGNIHQDKHLLS